MRGLRGRMTLLAMGASAAALLAVLLLVGPGLRRRAVESTRRTLMAEARLMARVVEEALARGAGPEELDPLVDDAAREVSARVTIIRTDGRVVADSALSGPDLLALENHGHRPEVLAALAAETGDSIRHSTTVNEDLLYAAVAVKHHGSIVGVARVAQSLADVEGQVGALRLSVAAALGLAFVLTTLLSTALAPQLAGPLRDIMQGAREFAAGNLGARIRIHRDDELGELAGILNQTGAQLQQRFADSAREQARTEAILASMEDGVLAVDHHGRVLLANAALRDGLDLHDAVGRHYVEAIRQREVDEIVEEVLRTGERRTAEVELRHGGRAYVLAGTAFPGAAGEPFGAVLTFHDVSERRRLERIRRDFVANASHELRTPLTSIRGFVEALEDGAIADPPTSVRFLEKIRRHADRMAALVEDLLELSRLESGERPPRLEPLRPAELVEDVVASFVDQADRKQIAVTWADAGAPNVVSDPERLRRILENLLDNAIKYTQDGGHVEVRVSAGGDGVRFEVQDDGPGIPTAHVPRIFERFYRVDKARSREIGGTGLGLAIVKHLCESLGAGVSVQSEPGRGTRFTISVPPPRTR